MDQKLEEPRNDQVVHPVACCSGGGGGGGGGASLGPSFGSEKVTKKYIYLFIKESGSGSTAAWQNKGSSFRQRARSWCAFRHSAWRESGGLGGGEGG